MASVEKLPMGQLERNDWNEDDMCQHKWAVVSEVTKEDLMAQNIAMGFFHECDPLFRFFYKVVALD